MTLNAFKAIVLSADPNAGHYDCAHRSGDAYTVWREVRRINDMADDGHHGAMAYQVDRFTKSEDDAVATALLAALDGHDEICVQYLIDYESDMEYVHHIFDCETY